MSKLETKLTASIKPGHSRQAEKSAPAKAAAAPAKPAQAPARKTQPSTGDLNALAMDLHPVRVWPD